MKSFTADTLNYLLITSDKLVWLMNLRLYSCGVGYIHIPGWGSTKLHSTFLSTNLPHSQYVCGQMLQNKMQSFTAIYSYYISKCGLINVSCVILMWCWIYTYPCVWQYQTTQYIFEYQFASFTVCLWSNITQRKAIIHYWHTKLNFYYIRQ